METPSGTLSPPHGGLLTGLVRKSTSRTLLIMDTHTSAHASRMSTTLLKSSEEMLRPLLLSLHALRPPRVLPLEDENSTTLVLYDKFCFYSVYA